MIDVENNRGVLSVTQLNEYLKSLLEQDPLLSEVSVRGEISNFVRHKSRHLYFSLKDQTGALRAVMFRSSAVRLPFMPENGMKVIASGSISVFVRDGGYQLYVRAIEPDGIGALALAFEQLKKKLEAEGLFSAARKKPIPKIPKRIGVVTSPTGAAIRDILQVLTRRFPLAEVVIFPALVQGADAPRSLVAGIEHFQRKKNVDLVIIGRGGGSMEDLWAFNDEGLARSIAACCIPVISAVGHERDFTICDFVADLRAPTPSAAAELAVPDEEELARKIQNVTEHMHLLLHKRHQQLRRELMLLSSHKALSDPERLLREYRLILDRREEQLSSSEDRILLALRKILGEKAAKLDALSPLSVLVRGYGVISGENGQVLTTVDALAPRDLFRVRLQDGTILGRVEKTEKQELRSGGRSQ